MIRSTPRQLEHWKVRLVRNLWLGLVTGVIAALFNPGDWWLMLVGAISVALLWFAVEPLIKPRRPLRDPVMEESLVATEAAIRLAEKELAEQHRRSD